jgi:hypothetical protein
MNADEIRAIEIGIGTILPKEIHLVLSETEYYNSIFLQENLEMNLNSSKILKLHSELAEYSLYNKVLPFWETSEMTAYVYYSGARTGKVYFLNHDGQVSNIAFRSLKSFLDTWVSNLNKKNWHDLLSDYFSEQNCWRDENGKFKPRSEIDIRSDSFVKEELLTEYIEDKKAWDEEFSLPDSDTQKLYEIDYHKHQIINDILAIEIDHDFVYTQKFLNSDDYDLQASVCELIQEFDYQQFIPDLIRIARDGPAKVEAQQALKSFGIEDQS